jgi:hypothetical protein
VQRDADLFEVVDALGSTRGGVGSRALLLGGNQGLELLELRLNLFDGFAGLLNLKPELPVGLACGRCPWKHGHRKGNDDLSH